MKYTERPRLHGAIPIIPLPFLADEQIDFVAVPVARDGNTVELHAWLDCHLFPVTPIGPPPAGHGPVG